MLKVGLIDVDGHNFPNLALMKISAHHKSVGDEVVWANAMEQYDLVYQSKVFDETYSDDIEWMPNADTIYKGGTGYIRRRRGDEEFPYEIYHCGKWRKCEGTDYLFRCGYFAVEGCEIYREQLVYEVEHIYPDYSLYPELTKDTAYGYLTRGCPRQCSFCGVAEKEGCVSRKVANLDEFWRNQKYIKLLDPNLL